MANKAEGTATAYIERGFIKISVPVADLPRIVRDGSDWGHLPTFAERGVRVIDVDQFAKDVVCALNAEKENGTTPVHLLFDAAFEKAVDDGSLGVDLLGSKFK